MRVTTTTSTTRTGTTTSRPRRSQGVPVRTIVTEDVFRRIDSFTDKEIGVSRSKVFRRAIVLGLRLMEIERGGAAAAPGSTAPTRAAHGHIEQSTNGRHQPVTRRRRTKPADEDDHAKPPAPPSPTVDYVCDRCAPPARLKMTQLEDHLVFTHRIDRGVAERAIAESAH